jgi:hypothetical protein
MDMATANALDSALEREARELARRLRAVADGHRFQGTRDAAVLWNAAKMLEERADHIVAVWD